MAKTTPSDMDNNNPTNSSAAAADPEGILSRGNTLWTQGVSALMIMLMHYVMQIDGYPRVLNILGSIGVAAFLFVSGFGLDQSYKQRGLAHYWRKRLLRVAVPYWAVCILRLPFADGFAPEQLLRNFLFCGSDLWFVDYIVKWYVVYWLARRFVPRYATWALAAFAVACVFMGQFESEQAFSFFGGYLASQHYGRLKLMARKSLLRIAAAAFAYAALLTIVKELPAVQAVKGSLAFNVLLLNIKLPFAVALMAVPCLMPWAKKIPLVRTAGKMCYELYIVHFNFMPLITGVGSMAAFAAASWLMAWVFEKLDSLLRRQTAPALGAFVFIIVSWALMCKYSMRATSHYGYVCTAYATLLAAAFLALRSKAWDAVAKHKAALWAALAVLALAMLAVQYHFDPGQNRVDRWSAIANPLSALFDGQFPYAAKTHLGGNASPFPVWMAFHIPFWALGNVGLSEVFAAVVFVLSVRLVGGTKAALKAAALMALCVNLWYETAVRSDLIANFLLLAAFVNLLIAKGPAFDRKPLLLSALAGLWLSTRVSTFFPMFVMFFPYWLKLGAKTKIAAIAVALAVFALTFAPLVAWDWNELFFAENNPFSLQSRQGRPEDYAVLLAAALCFALGWRGDTSRLLLFSAIILALVPTVAYCHSMWLRGNWTEIFTSYDITYLDAALPFCATLMALESKKAFCNVSCG